MIFINKADLPILCQIFYYDATNRYLRELNDLVSSEDGIKQFLYSFSCYVTRNEGFLWWINLNANLVGFIAMMDIPDKPTLFYAMHPAYRSQGIMKECILEAVSFILKN